MITTEKRLIDADTLKKQQTYLWDEALGTCACVLVEDIDKVPSVDAVEMVREQWIPVLERLPEENNKVLACLSSEITVVALLRQNAWYVSWNHAPLNHVTHWMQLPVPPKEVE